MRGVVARAFVVLTVLAPLYLSAINLRSLNDLSRELAAFRADAVALTRESLDVGERRSVALRLPRSRARVVCTGVDRDRQGPKFQRRADGGGFMDERVVVSGVARKSYAYVPDARDRGVAARCVLVPPGGD